MDTLVATVVSLEEVLGRFEPSSLGGEEAARAVEVLARGERLCAAAKARAAVRVEECRAHPGARSAGEWLARESGSTVGQARRSLETAKAVEDLPATKKAFTSGELSEAQAELVAKAAAADPAAESQLLDTARRRDLPALREHARKVRQASEDAEDLHRRQQAMRAHRHWIDDEGMVCGHYRLTPEVGAAWVTRLEEETDRIFRQAYRDGRREPSEAYEADAFIALMGSGPRRSTKAELVVVVDLDAFRRGHAHEGERCHIPGVGLVPVTVARRIYDDAFVKGVVVDGTDIRTVRHFGRYIPAEVRTALELGPDLDGATCSECGKRRGLEWDHEQPFAAGGPTAYDNLGGKCRDDHREKTARDRQLGLVGGHDPP